MGIRSSEETRVYEKSRSDVMASLVRAMEALKLKIEQRDDASGRTRDAITSLRDFS